MRNTNSRMLRNVAKAALTTTNDGSGQYGAILTIEQVRDFLSIAITPQVMLRDVRTVTSNAAKWEESKIDFARTILRPANEATRLSWADRMSPDTGKVEISTELFRGEVPLSDEIFEDNVELDGLADTFMTNIAEAVGRDIEDVMLSSDRGNSHVRGDVNKTASLYRQFNGWIALARSGISGSDKSANNADRTDGQLLDATNHGTDYDDMFKRMMQLLENRFKRSLEDFRFYVHTNVCEALRDQRAERGTAAGDMYLEGMRELRYQNIPIIGVPLMPTVSDADGTDTAYCLLSRRDNLYAGFRRYVKLETWRDPREGATSYIVTTRFAPAIAVPEAVVIAKNVNVEV
jgi:HK97 family phage major capsid protein